MNFCDHCLAPLTKEVTHCPECGLPITSGTDDPLLIAEEERMVNPRLAYANLLRMRGQWEETIRVCADVLKQFPHNVSAHSLMGDIYRDMGNLEEAAQWYKLATDLAPDSIVDRRRLEQVQKELQLRRQAQDQSQMVTHLQKQTRMLRIFSATVLGVAVIAAIGITWAFRGRPQNILNTPIDNVVISTSRASNASSLDSLPAPNTQTETAPATVLQPSPATETPPPAAIPERLQRLLSEEDLYAEKVKTWLSQRNIAPNLLNVLIDQPGNRWIISFGYASVPSREVLHRTAWLSAAAAFAIQPELQIVRVRCLAPGAVLGSEKMLKVCFAADISRKLMPAQPEETPLKDIPTFLHNVYVNPEAGFTANAAE